MMSYRKRTGRRADKQNPVVLDGESLTFLDISRMALSKRSTLL